MCCASCSVVGYAFGRLPKDAWRIFTPDHVRWRLPLFAVGCRAPRRLSEFLPLRVLPLFHRSSHHLLYRTSSRQPC